MENFKGTKGNWNYEEIESGAGLFHCIVKKKSDSIVTYVMPDYDEFKANALLIAKAPELLEEHQTDIDYLENWIEWLSDLKDDKYIGITDIMKSQLQVKKDLVKSATELS